MTLAQLTEVAREAGIEPSALLSAARAVEQGALVPTQQHTAFGLPVGVSRTAEFSRPVSTEEWERLVVVLRETLQARGTMRQEGSLRSWSNATFTRCSNRPRRDIVCECAPQRATRFPCRLGVGGVVMAGVVGVALAFKPDMSGPVSWRRACSPHSARFRFCARCWACHDGPARARYTNGDDREHCGADPE